MINSQKVLLKGEVQVIVFFPQTRMRATYHYIKKEKMGIRTLDIDNTDNTLKLSAFDNQDTTTPN
jgi:hypothetical protein